MGEIADLINKYGFPIIAAAGLGYFVYFVWEWATKEIKPVLSEASTVLIALIDRIRMLDNDLIRLNQKINIVLQLRGKEIESERHLHDVETAAKAQKRELEAADKQVKAAEELAAKHNHEVVKVDDGAISVPEQKTQQEPDKEDKKVK
jgi:hypothetical protein